MLSTVVQFSSKCTRRLQDPQQGDSVGLFFDSGISGSLRDVGCRLSLPFEQFPQLRIRFLLLLRLSCFPTQHNSPPLTTWVTLYVAGILSLQILSSGPSLDVSSSRKASTTLCPLGSLACALSCCQSVENGICIRAQLKGRRGSRFIHLPSPEPSRAWHTVGTQTKYAG